MTDVLTIDDLVGLLDRFGMKVGIDLDGAAADGVSAELITARLAHALVGVAEAHASRAEDAARRAGAGVADIGEVALMAFAGANCQHEADEWALIEWRAAAPAGPGRVRRRAGPHDPAGGRGAVGDGLGPSMLRSTRCGAMASPRRPAGHCPARWTPWSRPPRTRRCTAISVT